MASDIEPLPHPAALHLDGDQPFGQWSDTVQIALQG